MHLNASRDGGFTLVELAIVLVVIGIIIGAVMKGQDLIKGARTKRFINKVKEWENIQWVFYDRYGRFAGDQNGDSVIGGGHSYGCSSSGESVRKDLENATFIRPPWDTEEPSNIIAIGSHRFYVFFHGREGNGIVICASSNCSEPFDDDALEYIKALDTAIDGVADGKNGQVVAISGNCWGCPDYWVMGKTSIGYGCDSRSNYTSGNIKAAIYYFINKW